MRLVLYCTYVPADEIVAVAVEAERLGFDGISFPDHVVYPLGHGSRYLYTSDGSTPWDERMDWPDPFAAMAAVAARTERLLLLTGILVLPLRHPLFVAKSTATVDAISGGRLGLGIGVGWLREEFEALDLDYSRRGRMTDESIGVLRRLWTGEPTEHEGETWSFPEVTVRPPAAHPIPIYVGGKSAGALRRAGRLGDGFIPPVGTEEETGALIAEVERIRVEAGRDEEPFEVIAPATVAAGVEDFRRLAKLGIDTVRVDPFALYVQKYGGLTLEQRREALERYAAEVIEPLRATEPTPRP